MLPRLALLAALVLAIAAPAYGQAEQVPLEVRPAQGPVGSSAILLATGFTPDENVTFFLDGTQLQATDSAYSDGSLGFRLPMPDAIGIHRVVIRGETSQKTAIGTFTTTQPGLARPAIGAAPRPTFQTQNTARPYLAEIFAVNFSANTALTLRCPCSDTGYVNYDFATTDAGGDAVANFDFAIGDYGMIDLGMSEGAGLGGTILAADAVIKPGVGFSVDRRLRAVPPVGPTSGRTYIVGSGFTPGASVNVDEDAADERTVTADAFGGVVTFDDDGLDAGDDSDNPTTSTKAKEGGQFGAVGAARSTATLQPTAGVTNDLVPAQRTTRVVAVGLPPSTPVTIAGLDSAGAQTVLAVATTGATGNLDPVTVQIPRAAAAGPYRIEVDGGSAQAYTSLGVTGPIDPVQVTRPKETVNVDANGNPVEQPGGGSGDGPGKRELRLTVARKVKIRTLARDGVKVSVDLREFDCGTRCAVTGQLLASRAVARRFGATGSAKQLPVARTTSTARRTTRAALRLKLTKRGAERLRRLRKLTFRLRVQVADTAKNRATAERNLLAVK